MIDEYEENEEDAEKLGIAPDSWRLLDWNDYEFIPVFRASRRGITVGKHTFGNEQAARLRDILTTILGQENPTRVPALDVHALAEKIIGVAAAQERLTLARIQGRETAVSEAFDGLHQALAEIAVMIGVPVPENPRDHIF